MTRIIFRDKRTNTYHLRDHHAPPYQDLVKGSVSRRMFASECQWVPSHLTDVRRFSVSKDFLFPWAEQAEYSGVSQTCAAACATENFI